MRDFETWFAPIALIASTIAAVVTIFYGNRSQKREVTFTGTPVDKKDFDQHLRENKDEHDKFFAKLDVLQAESKADRDKLHYRINPIEGEICALREASETNTTRLMQMDGKIDRLIERMK
jgi:hypothetical protein